MRCEHRRCEHPRGTCGAPRRWGRPVWRVGEARLDDTLLVKARVVEAPQVISGLLVKVKGQVTVKVLLVALVQGQVILLQVMSLLL